MPASLHEQLADELGVDPDTAQSALQEYLDEVRARLESGEAIEIPGIGIMSTDEGELTLTPNTSLQEAVNYRNAHLEPLTVTDAPTPQEPESPEEEGDGAMAPPVDPPEEEPAEDAAEDDVVPDLSDDWTTELDDEPAEPPPSTEEDTPSENAREGATTAQIAGLVAAVALLFLALGYVVTSQGLLPGFGPASETAPAAASSVPETTATSTAPDTASPERAAEAPSETQTTPSSASQSIDRARGGWTLVIASRTQPGEAKAVLTTYRQRFRGEGLPTDILTGESSGQLRYRVTVGQYDSRQAAMTARQQLTGRIPDDAWPLEIQPGS